MRKLRFTNQSGKFLNKLIKRTPEISKTLAIQIEKLRDNPTPRNSTKILGYSCYRARVGSYRVVYEFDDETLLDSVVTRY